MHRSGFTLIELMVAISILAIISTAGLIIFTGAQKNARDGKRIGDLSEVQKALEQYYALNRSYPNNGLTASTVNTQDITTNNFASFFRSGSPPKDPLSPSQEYTYTAGGSCSAGLEPQYIICTKLETCGTRCNRGALPADGCATVADTVSPSLYYCIGTP